MPTAQQAGKLWCPLRNKAQRLNVLSDADSDGCIADQCAMWRWDVFPERRFVVAPNVVAQTVEEAGIPIGGVPENWEFCQFDVDPAGWVEPEADQMARRQGYCGLAGKS